MGDTTKKDEARKSDSNRLTEILVPTKVVLLRNMEEGMATHSSFLAWRIPWTEEPGRLQSIGSN